MKRLDRYIGRHVLRGSLLVLAILVVLFLVIDFIDDLGNVGRGNYTLLRALEHMALSVPRMAFSALPIAALIGTLMALGSLAGSEELTVVRAAGVSLKRLTFTVMRVGAVLVLLTLFLGEILMPFSERSAEERRSIALSDRIVLKTSEGFWIRDKQSFINIRQLLAHKQMGEIYVYEFDDNHQLQGITHAKKGQYLDGKWVLETVSKNKLTPTGITGQKMDRAEWTSLLAPDVVDAIKVRPESLSIPGLYRHIAYLRDNGLNSAIYEFAIWAKLIYPMATGIMMFVAIPMVLGWLRSVGIGQRIVVGTLLGIVFHIVQQTVIHLGLVFEMNPFLCVSIPIAAFLGFGFWMMGRVR